MDEKELQEFLEGVYRLEEEIIGEYDEEDWSDHKL